jgi:hypothetical protein
MLFLQHPQTTPCGIPLHFLVRYQVLLLLLLYQVLLLLLAAVIALLRLGPVRQLTWIPLSLLMPLLLIVPLLPGTVVLLL